MEKLTEEQLLSKNKASSLEEIKHLSLWGLKLEDVSIVSKLPNIETIALSVNEIKTLAPFQHCVHLRELFLRRNKIPSLSEINYLTGLPELQTLWLADNPITKEPNYRKFVIAMLPHLTKLDEVDITPQEREEATKVFNEYKSSKAAKATKSKPSPESTTSQEKSTSKHSKPSSSNSSANTTSNQKSTQPVKTQGVSKESQDNIISAICILLKELDNDALDVLSDQLKQMRKK